MIIPLDLTGTKPDNRLGVPVTIKGTTTAIMGEVITSPYGLFFNNVTLIDRGTKLPLKEHEDYVLGAYDKEFYAETSILGYRSIVLLNSTLSPNLQLVANYAGGKWVDYGQVQIPELIELALLTKRQVVWANLEGAPEEGNPLDHDHAGSDYTTGFDPIVASLWSLYKNRQAVSPEMVLSIASSVFSTMQPVNDQTLLTTDKTVLGAISEVKAVAQTTLNHLTATTPPNILMVTDENNLPILPTGQTTYLLVGKPDNGGNFTLNMVFDNGDTSRSLAFGSVVEYNGTVCRDITGSAAVLTRIVRNASQVLGLDQTIVDGLNALLGWVDYSPEVNGSNVLLSDTTIPAATSNTYYLVVRDIKVTAYYAGGALSTRDQPAGTLLLASPLAVRSVSDFITRGNYGKLYQTENGLTTPSKVVTTALETIDEEAIGPFRSKDVVEVLAGVPVSDPTLHALDGTVLSKAEYPELYAVFGNEYLLDEDNFALPPQGLGDIRKVTVEASTPLTLGKVFGDSDGGLYHTVVDEDLGTITVSHIDTTNRQLTDTVTFSHNCDSDVKVVGPSTAGVIYFTGVVSGVKGFFGSDVFSGSPAPTKVRDLPAGESVVHKQYTGVFYIISALGVSSIDPTDNSTVLVSNIGFTDEVLSCAAATAARLLYVSTPTGIRMVSLVNDSYAVQTYPPGDVCYDWLLDNLYYTIHDGPTLILDKLTLDHIGTIDQFYGFFDGNDLVLRDVGSDTTKFMQPVTLTNYYTRYIKE